LNIKAALITEQPFLFIIFLSSKLYLIITMFTGFEQIIEKRIKAAQKKGEFDNLPGAGKPIVFDNDSHIPEDLRLAYKILKNADCIPPEIELKKKVQQTEDLLSTVEDAKEKYRILKKLNFIIMKINTIRDTSILFDVPQKYMEKISERVETQNKHHKELK